MTEPQISILDNGLTVASWLQPGLETAAVALTAETGSRFERMPLSTRLAAAPLWQGGLRGTARAEGRACCTRSAR